MNEPDIYISVKRPHEGAIACGYDARASLGNECLVFEKCVINIEAGKIVTADIRLPGNLDFEVDAQLRTIKLGGKRYRLVEVEDSEEIMR